MTEKDRIKLLQLKYNPNSVTIRDKNLVDDIWNMHINVFGTNPEGEDKNCERCLQLAVLKLLDAMKDKN